jgi:deoxyadenosine/deoxycytidine kinase
MQLIDKGIIVIIGFAASGKTTLTDQLKELYPSAKFYHTDDYIKYGFEQSLYVLMEHLAKDKSELVIIEGIQCYRLLRKGIELKSFKADLIVEVVASEATRAERIDERGKSVNAIFNMDKTLTKVWNDYVGMVGVLPKIIKHEGISKVTAL